MEDTSAICDSSDPAIRWKRTVGTALYYARLKKWVYTGTEGQLPLECSERPKPARSHRWDSPRIDATLIAAYSSESIEKQSAPSPQALFRFSIVSNTMRVDGRIKIGDLIGYVGALEERFSFP